MNPYLSPESETWIIGDVHGCLATLEKLFESIDAQSSQSRIYFVGDLVGKGPESAGVLDFVMNLGERAHVTLGNHDLHLLACEEGITSNRPTDRTDRLLGAPASKIWRDWFLQQGFHHDLENGDTKIRVVHAGIKPDWSEDQFLHLSSQAALAIKEGLSDWYKKPGHPIWEVVSILTRIRCVNIQDGSSLDNFTDHPKNAPQGHKPWFDVPRSSDNDRQIVFGHWARLGEYHKSGIHGIDTGCVYGGELVAMNPFKGTILREGCCDDLEIAP